MGLNTLSVPVVDLESICLRSIVSDADFERVGEAIIEGFEETGFVYLTNHGVMKQKLDQLLSAFDKFFDLDSATKNKYIASHETLHGYTTEKLEKIEGTNDSISGHDCFEYQGYDQHMPKDAPLLKETIAGLLEKTVPMVEKVMRAIGCGLGVPFEQFGAHHTNMVNPNDFSGLRMLRYDPVGDDDERFELRFSEHVDYGVTATFHLCDDVGGLQIKDRSGVWQNSQISHDTFLLFPGQVLQRWTSDRITAATHRVVIPQTKEERNRFRHSVIFFATPKKDTLLKCFDGLDKYPPRTEAKEMEEGIQMFYKPT